MMSKTCLVLLCLFVAILIHFVRERKITNGTKTNTESIGVRVAHILVDSEEKANDILKEIESGKISFEKSVRFY